MSGHVLQRRRRDTEFSVPPECGEMIRRGALVALNVSGGKDSQALTIILSRIVPRDQLVAVHAPLGEVEWEGTIQLIEATLPQGVPLIFAPVTSGKSLLDRVEERGKFPGIHQRWCTASHKRDPIERELRHFLKTQSSLWRSARELPWHPARRKRCARQEDPLAAQRPHERGRTRSLRLAADLRSLHR